MISYHSIISVENLLIAWKEFLAGKKQKADTQAFSTMLMDNIITLHDDLANFSYVHGPYKHFKINDPKPRDIHKASVRDRLLHRAIHRVLYPFFSRTFASDSFSCQIGKGTHRAMNRFRVFAYQVSQNHTRTCWVLKCDIRKFFANIDHEILKKILSRYIPDQNILWLLSQIMNSFKTKPAIGLPLGNLTSQLLVNIYMNEFDQWMKHHMNVKHYIRYADDFVILSSDKDWLLELLPKIADFLSEELHLQLHPDKVFVKTISSGVDFLGWIHFPNHRVLRTSTKRRMFANMKSNHKPESLASYRGILQHGNGKKLEAKVSFRGVTRLGDPHRPEVL